MDGAALASQTEAAAEVRVRRSVRTAAVGGTRGRGRGGGAVIENGGAMEEARPGRRRRHGGDGGRFWQPFRVCSNGVEGDGILEEGDWFL